MSTFQGKLEYQVTKNRFEYFKGMIGKTPMKGYWSKKGGNKRNDICVFLDVEKINYLDKQGKSAGPKVQTEPVEQAEAATQAQDETVKS